MNLSGSIPALRQACRAEGLTLRVLDHPTGHTIAKGYRFHIVGQGCSMWNKDVDGAMYLLSARNAPDTGGMRRWPLDTAL